MPAYIFCMQGCHCLGGGHQFPKLQHKNFHPGTGFDSHKTGPALAPLGLEHTSKHIFKLSTLWCWKKSATTNCGNKQPATFQKTDGQIQTSSPLWIALSTFLVKFRLVVYLFSNTTEHTEVIITWIWCTHSSCGGWGEYLYAPRK